MGMEHSSRQSSDFLSNLKGLCRELLLAHSKDLNIGSLNFLFTLCYTSRHMAKFLHFAVSHASRLTAKLYLCPIRLRHVTFCCRGSGSPRCRVCRGDLGKLSAKTALPIESLPCELFRRLSTAKILCWPFTEFQSSKC